MSRSIVFATERPHNVAVFPQDLFTNLVLKRLPFDDTEHYIDLLKKTLLKNYRVITEIHRYFSVLGSGDLTTMRRADYDIFLEVKINHIAPSRNALNLRHQKITPSQDKQKSRAEYYRLTT
jgi:hypothetical protein